MHIFIPFRIISRNVLRVRSTVRLYIVSSHLIFSFNQSTHRYSYQSKVSSIVNIPLPPPQKSYKIRSAMKINDESAERKKKRKENVRILLLLCFVTFVIVGIVIYREREN